MKRGIYIRIPVRQLIIVGLRLDWEAEKAKLDRGEDAGLQARLRAVSHQDVFGGFITVSHYTLVMHPIIEFHGKCQGNPISGHLNVETTEGRLSFT